MAAYVVPVSRKDWPVVKKYLAALREGGILLAPKVVTELRNQTGTRVDGELFLEEYDFGGEADLWVDVAYSVEHLAIEGIRHALTSTEVQTLDDDE